MSYTSFNFMKLELKSAVKLPKKEVIPWFKHDYKCISFLR